MKNIRRFTVNSTNQIYSDGYQNALLKSFTWFSSSSMTATNIKHFLVTNHTSLRDTGDHSDYDKVIYLKTSQILVRFQFTLHSNKFTIQSTPSVTQKLWHHNLQKKSNFSISFNVLTSVTDGEADPLEMFHSHYASPCSWTGVWACALPTLIIRSSRVLAMSWREFRQNIQCVQEGVDGSVVVYVRVHVRKTVTIGGTTPDPTLPHYSYRVAQIILTWPAVNSDRICTRKKTRLWALCLVSHVDIKLTRSLVCRSVTECVIHTRWWNQQRLNVSINTDTWNDVNASIHLWFQHDRRDKLNIGHSFILNTTKLGIICWVHSDRVIFFWSSPEINAELSPQLTINITRVNVGHIKPLGQH